MSHGVWTRSARLGKEGQAGGGDEVVLRIDCCRGWLETVKGFGGGLVSFGGVADPLERPSASCLVMAARGGMCRYL